MERGDEHARSRSVATGGKRVGRLGCNEDGVGRSHRSPGHQLVFRTHPHRRSASPERSTKVSGSGSWNDHNRLREEQNRHPKPVNGAMQIAAGIPGSGRQGTAGSSWTRIRSRELAEGRARTPAMVPHGRPGESGRTTHRRAAGSSACRSASITCRKPSRPFLRTGNHTSDVTTRPLVDHCCSFRIAFGSSVCSRAAVL